MDQAKETANTDILSDNTDVPVSRRDLATILGVLGGAAVLSEVSGCASAAPTDPPEGQPAERIGQVSSASTGTDVQSGFVVSLSGPNAVDGGTPGGDIPIADGATILSTQKGMPQNTLNVPFEMQWANPSVKGGLPVSWVTNYSINNIDGGADGTYDNATSFGYNLSPIGGVAGQPQVTLWSLETYFEQAVGQHQSEMHWGTINSNDGNHWDIRIFDAIYRWESGEVDVNIRCQNGGRIGLNGGPLNYATWTDTAVFLGVSGYSITGTGPLTLSTPGLLQVASTGGSVNVLGEVGSVSLTAAQNIVLQAEGAGSISSMIADTWYISDHTGATKAFLQLNTGVAEFCPWTTNTGSLGLSTNVWSAVFTDAVNTGGVTTAQSTKSANYTINSGTTPDHTIWMSSASGSFTLTLPAPKAGMIFLLVDSGNGLASHNVTLARHASETINGVRSEEHTSELQSR